MQKSDNTTFPNAHRRVQNSTTLSRKYVERPRLKTSSITRSPEIKRFNTKSLESEQQKAEAQKIEPATTHPLQASAIRKMNEQKKTNNEEISAKKIKEQEIKKAVALASKMDTGAENKKFKKNKIHFGFGRVVLASVCAVVAVLAFIYLVDPGGLDTRRFQEAAAQAKIDAKYPKYVPRNFGITDITSEDGKIVLNFKNAETDTTFSITEEKSSWDSNILLNNFVRQEYGDNYIPEKASIDEKETTVYISNNGAAWVSGGVVYKIKITSGSLTRKILTNIVISGWE